MLYEVITIRVYCGFGSSICLSSCVEHYARIVERTNTLRRLIGAAGEIAALAYEDTDNVDEVVDQAEQEDVQFDQKMVA